MKNVCLPVAVFLCTSVAFSQDFDINRTVLFDSTVLHPFKVQKTLALSNAFHQGLINESDRVLIADLQTRKIVFLSNQMAYHHVAFKDDQDPWMISFCLACNSGAGFYTRVGNTKYHFEGAGLYDGMIILKDQETGSLWNHITGECLYGKLKGRKLKAFNLLHSTIKDVLLKSPDSEIALSDMTVYKDNPFYQITEQSLAVYFPNPELADQAVLGKQFSRTIAKEDTRLPPMTLGLGIWNDRKSRFYPSKAIDSARVIMEDFGNKRVVIYYNETSAVPFAFFTSARSFTMKGNLIHLDNGSVVTQNGVTNERGQLINPDKPLQMFTRWYGFALTFPSTGIYAASHPLK